MFTQINVNGTDKIEQLMLTGINKRDYKSLINTRLNLFHKGQ